MSEREISRLEVLQRVRARRMTQQQAGQVLGLSRRQIYRLLQSVKKYGAVGLISKRRGRRSNYQLAPGLNAEAFGFNPTALCRFRPDTRLREAAGTAQRHSVRRSGA